MSTCKDLQIPQWEKVLFRKQPHPDNYVPPSFLRSSIILSNSPEAPRYLHSVFMTCPLLLKIASVAIWLACYYSIYFTSYTTFLYATQQGTSPLTSSSSSPSLYLPTTSLPPLFTCPHDSTTVSLLWVTIHLQYPNPIGVFLCQFQDLVRFNITPFHLTLALFTWFLMMYSLFVYLYQQIKLPTEHCIQPPASGSHGHRQKELDGIQPPPCIKRMPFPTLKYASKGIITTLWSYVSLLFACLPLVHSISSSIAPNTMYTLTTFVILFHIAKADYSDLFFPEDRPIKPGYIYLHTHMTQEQAIQQYLSKTGNRISNGMIIASSPRTNDSIPPATSSSKSSKSEAYVCTQSLSSAIPPPPSSRSKQSSYIPFIPPSLTDSTSTIIIPALTLSNTLYGYDDEFLFILLTCALLSTGEFITHLFSSIHLQQRDEVHVQASLRPDKPIVTTLAQKLYVAFTACWLITAFLLLSFHSPIMGYILGLIYIIIGLISPFLFNFIRARCIQKRVIYGPWDYDDEGEHGRDNI